jgi:hypothetical protein
MKEIIHLAQNMVQWWAYVTTAMSFLACNKHENCWLLN